MSRPASAVARASRRLRLAARDFTRALDQLVDVIDEEAEFDVAIKNKRLEEAALEFAREAAAVDIVTGGGR